MSPHAAGYTTDQLAAGFQLACGLLIMLASFGWPRAWKALTLKNAAITPVYAVVTFCVVLQANLGEAGWAGSVRGHGLGRVRRVRVLPAPPLLCWLGGCCCSTLRLLACSSLPLPT